MTQYAICNQTASVCITQKRTLSLMQALQVHADWLTRFPEMTLQLYYQRPTVLLLRLSIVLAGFMIVIAL